MSVYTTVTREELVEFLKSYPVGELVGFEGISAGIENTNYFVDTTDGRWVLTLFERAKKEDLPYFLGLMDHLAHRGVPSASPLKDAHGRLLSELNGKPAALVHCLEGRSVMNPSADLCHEVGQVLAEMHKAGQSFPMRRINCRGLDWAQRSADQLMTRLDEDTAMLLKDELAFQQAQDNTALPAGITHSDLFRDNVLFHEGRLTGLIDFYFACNAPLLYDLAITVNDWCLMEDDELDPAGAGDRFAALLTGYQQVRVLGDDERAAWPAMLRAAALRFWVSRLYDWHFPRDGEMTFSKSPEAFEHILTLHRSNPPELPRS